MRENEPKGKFIVEIAASVLFGIPPLANAYHTSIVVEGEEYFFSDMGMCFDDKLVSHQGSPTEKYEAGRTDFSGTEMWWALQEHFRPGSYDLLRKNCNSFSDAALFFLLRKRLDKKYSSLESFGRTSPDMVKRVIYVPNPVADNFNIEDVVEAVGKLGAGKRVTKTLADARVSVSSQDHRIPHLPRPSTVPDRQALGDLTNVQQGPGARANEVEAAMLKKTLSQASEESASSQTPPGVTARPPPRKFASRDGSPEERGPRRPVSPPRQPACSSSPTFSGMSSSSNSVANNADQPQTTPRGMARFLTNRVYGTNRKAPGAEKENLTPRGTPTAQGATVDENRRSRSKGPTNRSGISLKSILVANPLAARGGA